MLKYKSKIFLFSILQQEFTINKNLFWEESLMKVILIILIVLVFIYLLVSFGVKGNNLGRLYIFRDCAISAIQITNIMLDLIKEDDIEKSILEFSSNLEIYIENEEEFAMFRTEKHVLIIEKPINKKIILNQLEMIINESLKDFEYIDSLIYANNELRTLKRELVDTLNKVRVTRWQL